MSQGGGYNDLMRRLPITYMGSKAIQGRTIRLEF